MTKKILKDHKKVGKLLKPPLNTIGNFVDVSWIDYIIPDIIWIALLRDKFGDKVGTEIVNNFIEIATKHESPGFKIYAFISTFEKLPKENKLAIYNELKSENLLASLLSCLKEFLDMYPNCPFSFLRPNVTKMSVNRTFLMHYKNLLSSLVDKTSKISTFTIANVIYSLFTLGRLKIAKDSVMTQFPKIQEYPNTEISRLIASALRASINAFYSIDSTDKISSDWAKTFWNRGIEIENCNI